MDYHSLKRERMNDIFAERLHYEKTVWQDETSRGDWLKQISDDPLIFCVTVVIAYILYFVISFIVKPSLGNEKSDTQEKSGLDRLLMDHKFRDNIVPAKLKNLYETSPEVFPETTLTDGKVALADEDCIIADESALLLSDYTQDLANHSRILTL